LDGFTCADLFEFYDEGKACDTPLEVRNPPPGTKIKTVCPKSCSVCNDPVTTVKPVVWPRPPLKTTASPVVRVEKMTVQPDLKTKLKAMCRGKFSLFGSVSLKPDKSGKSKFALKELTKADRCFD